MQSIYSDIEQEKPYIIKLEDPFHNFLIIDPFLNFLQFDPQRPTKKKKIEIVRKRTYNSENSRPEGSNVNCWFCKKPGHIFKECPSIPEGYQNCFRCGKEGHILRNCPSSERALSLCFRCKQPGHQKKDCPQKERFGGVY